LSRRAVHHADTALRLAKYFGTSDLFLLNFQHDTTWNSTDLLGQRLEAEVHVFHGPAVPHPVLIFIHGYEPALNADQQIAFARKNKK